MTSAKLNTILAALLAFSGCSRNFFGRETVWTETKTETVSLPPSKSYEVRSHNGSIDTTASLSGSHDITYIKKTGGETMADALSAFEALDVYVEPGDDKSKIGWRWKKPVSKSWQAAVSFSLRAPAVADLVLETHNGSVQVVDQSGSVRATTHNGDIHVHSGPGELAIATHNGEIEATYSGSTIRAVTHNGKIFVDVSGAKQIGGEITTHNGNVELIVGAATSSDFRGITSNGEIDSNVTMEHTQRDRRSISGKLGSGGPPIEVTSHNGSIRVRQK